MARGSLGVKPDHPTGYVTVAVTRERIYALFSGRSFRQHGANADLGLFVHEFDWSGAFQRVLRLDRPADSIAVDESASALFASHPSPVPEIVVIASAIASPTADGSAFTGSDRATNAPTA